jgi:dTDP-4-amino-4,6-dideoxygalactose transaminase
MPQMTAPTPAILGGPAAFPDHLRLLRPTLPTFADLEARLRESYASGTITKGPILAEYERALADHLGVRHALGVSSCTAGLMLVFDRYRGADIVLPSFTFMATAMAAVWAGLKPIFADIDPDTWCLSPAAAAAALTPATAVVTPVHLFGDPADTAAFDTLAAQRGVAVVYDAAHGFGALRDGAPVGREGLAQVFSTSPTKLLITGEGGVVASDGDARAQPVVVGREYGNPGTYDPLFVGLNARLPETSALLGLKGLALLDREAEQRNALATAYRGLLGDLAGIGFQRIRPQDRSSFKDFSVRIRAAEFGLTRDQVATALAAEGIDTRAYYVPPVHRTRAFAAMGPAFEERLPETAALVDQVLTLPAYGRLPAAAVERVAACMIALHERAPAVRRALGEA